MSTGAHVQPVLGGEEQVPEQVHGEHNERLEPSKSMAAQGEQAIYPREHRGSHTAVVRVAYDLADAELRALRGILEKRFGGPIAIVVERDPKVLGGVWVRMGDIILDGSLHGRLEELRHHLRERNRELVLGPPRTQAGEKEP